jgi:hypothetical protein
LLRRCAPATIRWEMRLLWSAWNNETAFPENIG